MTPEEFVEVLRPLVVDTAVRAELRNLGQPLGSQPWPNVVRRSEWFNALSEHDQGMVAEVVRSAAFSATFGFCSVLDGVRAFDRAGGSLRLSYVNSDGTETILNQPQPSGLHDQLRGDGPPP